MKTSLKAGLAQIFSCCSKNLSCPKFGAAAAPLAPPTGAPMWRGHLCQNTVKCLKYFCNWLSHLRFTSKSDFHVSNSQYEDYSTMNK